MLQLDYTFPSTDEEEELFSKAKLPIHLNLAACKLQQRDFEEVYIQCRLVRLHTILLLLLLLLLLRLVLLLLLHVVLLLLPPFLLLLVPLLLLLLLFRLLLLLLRRCLNEIMEI